MLVVEKAVVLLTSLLVTPFLIRTLGTNDYGLWILILSILGWFNILDLGLPAAVQRYITIALEQGDNAKVNTVFSTSLALFSLIGLVAASAVLILASNPQILGATSIDEPTIALALSLLCLKVLWDFMMNCFHGFFGGLLRFDIDANISALNAITKAILIFSFVPSLNIKGAVIATLMADVLSNLLKVYYCKKLYPPLSFRITLVRSETIKELFQFSKHVVAIGVARTLNMKTAPFIIAQVLGLTSVALFSIADRLISHAQAFAAAISMTFGPVFTKKVARGESMENLFQNVSTINIFFAAAMFTPLLAFGSIFIELWVGVEFSFAYWIMALLVLVFFCRFLSASVRQTLFAQKNHQWLSVVQLAGAVVNITVAILLAARFGVMGVAAGAAVGAIIADVVLSLMLLRKYNDFVIRPVLKTFFLAI